MTVRELREKYLAFFESKGHQRFPSGSLVPYDVTGRLDESLLFNGAGMIQFKPYFLGLAKPDYPKLTTCQKCVRTGDIEEVGDDTHLTFFEMLGNFSFGDYFKEEAIRMSWEFLTDPQWLALDPKRLSFSVFEDDDEAEGVWRDCGAQYVVRLDAETNYWPADALTKGPPGPCGPNSEMFFWGRDDVPPPDPANYTKEQWQVDDAAGNWVEIWNDVFIQFDWQGTPKANGKGYDKTGMPELPFRSIDTGMGLDRTAFVLGGFRSVYDTDSFAPIFAKIDELSGFKASGEDVQKARRVIADHIRTASFCIADGVLPSNTGRGYVLRRLIRRAVLKGQRTLGISEPFMHLVFEGVLEAMGSFYQEIVDRRQVIIDALQSEELAFRKTLHTGHQLLEEKLKGQTLLSGETVFFLYDTFGFPLEITQEIAAEAGIEVDLDGYERALREAQARSRGGQEIVGAYEGMETASERVLDDAPTTTSFLGYSQLSATGKVARIRTQGVKTYVSLDQTPLYAAGGGQVGDQGTLTANSFTWNIVDTTKAGNLIWHDLAETDPPELGTEVTATVDGKRKRTQRNHTATHLLQAALRTVLGNHVTQAGSSVDSERLRFDFTHSKAMSATEIADVERMVNEEILRNETVETHVDLPIDEARKRGAMALFGEKYGDKVRMVEVGEFSRELCGGTHVRTTGEIGLFKITSESSAQSGVRRVEAITGEAAYEHELDEARKIREIADLLKSAVRDVVPAVERLLGALKEEKQKRQQAELRSLAPAEAQVTTDVNGIALWRQNLGEIDPKSAARIVDEAAANQALQVTLAVVVVGDKLQFIVKAGAEAVAKGAHAGNLLREVAKIAGGGGGGKPDFATAGGKDVGKADEALAAAESVLATMVK